MLLCAVTITVTNHVLFMSRQVLLKTSPESPLGLVAKLADFG
jgi:hypothetical protein